MRPRRLGSLIFAGALLCAVLAQSGGRASATFEHLPDGGFESGADGWLVHGASAATACDGEPVAAEGARCLALTLNETRASVRRRLDGALAAGTYRLSLDARSAGPRVTLISSLTSEHDGSAQDDVRTDVSSGGWTLISRDVDVAVSSYGGVLLVVEGPPGTTVFIDAVSVSGAAPIVLSPTPTAAATTGVVAASATVAVTAPASTATPTAVAAFAPEEALQNAGFEEIAADGVPLAWEKHGGVLDVSPRARSGAHAAVLTTETESTKWVHQAVLVEPGAWYRFDAWLLHDDPGIAAAFLRVSWYASRDGSGAALGSVDSTSILDAPVGAYRLLTTHAVQAPPAARSARGRIMVVPSSAARGSLTFDDAAWSRVQGPAPVVGEAVGAAPASAKPEAGGERAANPSQRRSEDAGWSAYPGRGAAAALLISEVLYDAQGIDDGASEWVELYNAASEPVALGGWSLADDAGAEALPDITIDPGGFVVVAASDSFRDAYPGFSGALVVLGRRIGNGLANGGDRVLLIDPAGAVVDAVSWGDDASAFAPPVADVPEGHSIERSSLISHSDRAADWVDNERPSPGAPLPAFSGRAPASADGTSELLPLDDASRLAWLPWGLVALSASALAAMAAWRAVESLRDRLRV